MGLLKRAFSKKADGNVTRNTFRKPNQQQEEDLWLNIRKEEDPSLIWRRIGELGDGAFGKVYKVQQKVTGILAAAKVIPTSGEEQLEEYRSEIDILSRILHTNVIRLLDAIYSRDATLWVMLEWCEGGALDAAMILRDSSFDEPCLQVIARHTAEALNFLHGKMVIHRDIKAGNLLLTNEGIVKLADFGVSVQNDHRDEKRTTFIGTPYWMAPEVVMCETFKDVPYDSKCDIWSFGITLIELAQLEPPHHDMNPVRVLLKIPKAEPPVLEEPDKWSRELNTMLKLCLKKDPKARSTAGELLQHSFLRNLETNQPLVDLYKVIKQLEKDKPAQNQNFDENFDGQNGQNQFDGDNEMNVNERRMEQRMARGGQRGGPGGPDGMGDVGMGDKIIVDGQEIDVEGYGEDAINDDFNKRILRRQELNELRKLQHDEQRAMAILTAKLTQQMEIMLTRFEQSRIEIEQKFDVEIENMSNLQKDRVQALEKEQRVDRKKLEANLKSDQRKDRSKFMSNLKEEKKDQLKLVKRMPVGERKATLKQRMAEIEQHQHYKEKAFTAKQIEQVADKLRMYDERSKRNLARAEREFLLEKQDLLKNRANSLWDMEERQLHDKHQTVKQQLREQYLLQRQQLLARHEKEFQQIERQNYHQYEDLDMRQKNEIVRLPKVQAQEHKTRLIMFKQALKVQNIQGDAERIRLRDFKAQEEKRQKAEIERQAYKHMQQKRELEENNISNLRELRQLQNEKKRLLAGWKESLTLYTGPQKESADVGP